MRTNNGHVIKPIIDLCHAQNKTVTAEGIEHDVMRQWLSEYQCDFMQGYLFGKPMSIEELEIWWESSNHMIFNRQNHTQAFAGGLSKLAK
jgi:EAL domain-containing protein (putative c-di-GMP-specific phosphodiesterase class I)